MAKTTRKKTISLKETAGGVFLVLLFFLALIIMLWILMIVVRLIWL